MRCLRSTGKDRAMLSLPRFQVLAVMLTIVVSLFIPLVSSHQVSAATVANGPHSLQAVAALVQPHVSSTTLFTQTAELHADNSNSFGQGAAISGDGNTAIFGGLDINQDLGAAYIYTKTGTTWSQAQELLPPNSSLYHEALSLSNDGSLVFIGDNGTDQVFVYTKTASTWNKSSVLTATDGARGFGQSVSLSGDGSTALIGATDPQYNSTGEAFILSKNGNAWTTTKIFTATNVTAFGQAASLSNDGSTAVIAAPSVNNNAGAVYVYTKSGTTWSQPRILTATNTTYFGQSVSVSGDGSYIFIGSSNNTAYIFSKNGSTWTNTQTFSPDGSSSFGYAVGVASDGNTAIVSDDTSGNYQGNAYVFSKNGATWNQTQIFTPTDSTANDRFGNQISLSNDGNTAAIAASLKNGYAGYAYILSRLSSATTLAASASSITQGDTITFTASVSPTTATGTVVFTDTTANKTLGSANVSNGVATLVTNTLSVGNHAVYAAYTGGDYYLPSTSNTVTVTVNSATNGGSNGYTYYLPFVANNANQFTTYLALQNIGSASANITVTYYDNNGAALTASTLVMQVAKYAEILPTNPFASGKQGTGIITSDQPLNVIVPEATPYGGSAYAVGSGSSNSLIAPFALNNAFGDFTTQLNIFNGGASAVTATVTFYGTVGSSTAITSTSTSVTIQPYTTYNLNQNTLPSGFSGWAQISGTANTLEAQVLEQSPNTKFVAIANAIANPSATEYAPAVFNAGYGGFYTGANIINPNSNAVTVTVTYYDLSANASTTTPFVLAAHGVASIFNGATSGNGLPSGGLPSGFIGSMAVSAVGGNIAMSVNENGGLTSTGNSRSGTYAAISSGGSTVGLPVVSNGGYTYVTGDTILNTSSQAVTATVSYYNIDGTSTGVSKSFTIAGHGSQAYYQGDGSLPSNFYGTAVITQTGGAANSLVVTTNAQNIALFYTYSEPNS